MIKVNEYFDGKVKSLEKEYGGERFSVGLLDPGQYRIPTEYEEHITPIKGKGWIKLPGEDWTQLNLNQKVVVPPKVEFEFSIEEPLVYLCIYQ